MAEQLGITLTVAVGRLTQYLTAEEKVLGSQSYEMGDRKLTRADLKEIREGIAYWQAHVDRLNPSPPPARAVGRVRGGSYRMR
jgi:hypothetical protein